MCKKKTGSNLISWITTVYVICPSPLTFGGCLTMPHSQLGWLRLCRICWKFNIFVVLIIFCGTFRLINSHIWESLRRQHHHFYVWTTLPRQTAYWKEIPTSSSVLPSPWRFVILTTVVFPQPSRATLRWWNHWGVKLCTWRKGNLTLRNKNGLYRVFF